MKHVVSFISRNLIKSAFLVFLVVEHTIRTRRFHIWKWLVTRALSAWDFDTGVRRTIKEVYIVCLHKLYRASPTEITWYVEILPLNLKGRASLPPGSSLFNLLSHARIAHRVTSPLVLVIPRLWVVMGKSDSDPKPSLSRTVILVVSCARSRGHSAVPSPISSRSCPPMLRITFGLNLQTHSPNILFRMPGWCRELCPVLGEDWLPPIPILYVISECCLPFISSQLR